jgi:hypothetical protein
VPWQELQCDEYDSVWNRFYSQFDFHPDYYERTVPAIQEPTPFETFDISPDISESQIDALNALFADAFLEITRAKQLIYALDWHHTSYKFDPRERSPWSLSILPDGDYYIFIADDFSFGTFGHPWQLSICVFGRSLLDVTSSQLRGMLPLLRSG